METNKLQGVFLDAFGALTAKEAEKLSALVTKGAAEKGFTYQRAGGVIETMHLMLVPSFFTEAQVEYLHRVSRAVKRGVEAAYRAYFHDSGLQRLLPLKEAESRWIRELAPSPPSPMEGGEPIWYRIDAHARMNDKDWRDTVSVFEINSCAVGGIHYSPVADSLFSEIILPFLSARLPALPPLRKNPDLRDLLLGLMRRHAAAVGRKTMTVAFSEDTTLEEGITEGPYIVEHLRRAGIRAYLADPRELYVKKDELYYKDEPIDIVYRNFEIGDIIEMEEKGESTGGIKFAFSNNRVVSSLAGDFDHKSMWEVLTNGMFDRYFSREDAALFKKHLLWTRTVKECRTEGPLGGNVDLIPFALRNKETLVLKPNRLCGGYGVTIGKNTSGSDWERMLEAAVQDEGAWVVQDFNPPEEAVFPLFEEGSLVFERRNVVYGISSTHEGTGVLGRVSKQNVVNVAQQGGLMPVVRAG